MSAPTMRKITLLPLLFVFAACASSSGIEPDRVLSCGPGQDIEILAGIEGVRNRAVIAPGEELAFLVEVANNSHEDVVVQSIRIDPELSGQGTSRLESVYRAVNQEIAQGKDHLFRFPTRERAITSAEPERSSAYRGPSEMTVTIVLTNGDVYRCPFSLGR